MAYQRKTQDLFFIVWNGEEIDNFETRKEARLMLIEYNMAYHGGCSIRKRRERL